MDSPSSQSSRRENDAWSRYACRTPDRNQMFMRREAGDLSGETKRRRAAATSRQPTSSAWASLFLRPFHAPFSAEEDMHLLLSAAQQGIFQCMSRHACTVRRLLLQGTQTLT